VPILDHEPAVPVPATPAVSLTKLASIVLRWRKLIGFASLSIVVLSTAVALLFPRRYTATALIMPPQQGSASGASLLAQMSNLGAMGSLGGGAGIKNPNDLQVSFLKSRFVEDGMAEKFQLQQLYGSRYLSTTRKRWERRTAIDNGLKDGLIRLSVTDTDPRRAAVLANGWVEEYRRLIASLALTEASQRRQFFERELAGARDELTRAEDGLKQTEQRTGVLEIDSQARAMIASAAVLRAQVAAKEVEIRAMREFAAGQNPDLLRAQQELAALEQQLASMDVASDRREGDLVAPRGEVTDAGLDYQRALREVKYREAMYELLTRQYEVARVDEAREGALVQVIDPAVPPDRPAYMYRIWIVIGSFVCALPLGLLAALAAEGIHVLRSCRVRAGSWLLAIDLAWQQGAR
jgi:uncharacterized protein involved in exopolysaccharide biosynthesis